ncbi:hypothetical protein [Anabaena sp. PCC 7108]|uniref:hypothetical protein n=1 Tax=Anabaena sp. PCC 7108 TaxID=163908 RepID=UPI00036501BD|nr:hypothetical protein [Anabaena sp. PCC 7108]
MKPNKCVGLRCRLTQPTKNIQGIVKEKALSDQDYFRARIKSKNAMFRVNTAEIELYLVVN